MQKKENRVSRIKIENLEAKKLSVEELAAVTGGASTNYYPTCCGTREVDDCGTGPQ